MNLLNHFLRRATVALALGTGIVLVPTGRAQPTPQVGTERYLFIFNTSADMKKRLPAVRAEVNDLLLTGLGGRLRPGDNLGVWTFDQDLHTGQFPLQLWRPEIAGTIAASINKFVGQQRYAHRTRFSTLQPQLNQVIKASSRLTVLIFCDGEGKFMGTSYDADINRVFQQRQADQKKALQPFVLVLRTQLGQYSGCTMNFPPGMVNIPEFPPLPAPTSPPAPAKPSPPPKPAPMVKPPPTGPPLFIVGTKVETNWPPASVPATPTNAMPAAVQTNATVASPSISVAPANAATSPKSKASPLPTNPAPVMHASATPPPRANLAPEAPAKPGRIAPSNSVAAAGVGALPPKAANPGRKVALVIGVVLLVAAGALAALAVFRRRPDRGSLITRSMRKD
jgi:hypothetical protein